MVKVRGVFREGSKVQPWEAFLQVFVIFGRPWGSRKAPFPAKKQFLESLKK